MPLSLGVVVTGVFQWMPVLLKVEQTVILSSSLAKKRPKKWMVANRNGSKGLFSFL